MHQPKQPPEFHLSFAGPIIMTSALLIVDMQQGSFTTATPRYDSDGLIKRLNRLARQVRRNDGHVVFVQHDGAEGDAHHPMQPGWKLLSDLVIKQEDLQVRKSSCDAFLNTKLLEILKAKNVETLIVSGCATDFCVDTTVRSALAHSYKTIVPRDGHTTADKPYLSAQKIIEHHNHIWSTFLSPVGPASIPACGEVFA